MKKWLPFALVPLMATGCFEKDAAYEKSTARNADIFEKAVLNPNTTYLYVPSTGAVPRYASSQYPFFQGQEKLVQLKFTENGIEVLQLDRDAELDENGQIKPGRYVSSSQESVEYHPVLTIPGTHLDFQCDEDKFGECTNSEEVIPKDESNPDAWKSWRFFEPDFAEINQHEVNYTNVWFEGGGLSTDNTELVSYEIKDGVINIELEKTFSVAIGENEFDYSNLSNNSFKTRFYYSLVDVNKLSSTGYKKIYYNDTDDSTFGFFESRVEKENINGECSRDCKVYTLLNRFNPEKKDLKYHLSSTFLLPENKIFMDATKQTIEVINQQLIASGVPPINLIVPESIEAAPNSGDLRYNMINLIDDPLDNGLLGYGPSVAHPLTGEIVQAHVNQYSGVGRSTARRVWNDLVVRYNRGDITLEPTVPTASPRKRAALELANQLPPKSLPEDQQQIKITEQLKQQIAQASLSEADIAGLKASTAVKIDANDYQQLLNSDSIEEMDKRVIKEETRLLNWGKQTAYPEEAIWVSSTHKGFIEGLNPSDTRLSKLDGELKLWSQLSDEAQEEISDAIALVVYKTTLVHELGHNLGLRHNFKGSNDADNFYSIEEAAELGLAHIPAYSSVMDYAPSQLDELALFGKYDMAALRFAYKRQVELEKDENKSETDGEQIVNFSLAGYDQLYAAEIEARDGNNNQDGSLKLAYGVINHIESYDQVLEQYNLLTSDGREQPLVKAVADALAELEDLKAKAAKGLDPDGQGYAKTDDVELAKKIFETEKLRKEHRETELAKANTVLAVPATQLQTLQSTVADATSVFETAKTHNTLVNTVGETEPERNLLALEAAVSNTETALQIAIATKDEASKALPGAENALNEAKSIADASNKVTKAIEDSYQIAVQETEASKSDLIAKKADILEKIETLTNLTQALPDALASAQANLAAAEIALTEVSAQNPQDPEAIKVATETRDQAQKQLTAVTTDHQKSIDDYVAASVALESAEEAYSLATDNEKLKAQDYKSQQVVEQLAVNNVQQAQATVNALNTKVTTEFNAAEAAVQTAKAAYTAANETLTAEVQVIRDQASTELETAQNTLDQATNALNAEKPDLDIQITEAQALVDIAQANIDLVYSSLPFADKPFNNAEREYLRLKSSNNLINSQITKADTAHQATQLALNEYTSMKGSLQAAIDSYDELAQQAGADVSQVQNYNLKSYNFCNDGNVILNSDCNRFDEGTNLEEIIDYRIQRYEDTYRTLAARDDRLNFGEFNTYYYQLYRYRMQNELRDTMEDYGRWDNIFIDLFDLSLTELHDICVAENFQYDICHYTVEPYDNALKVGNYLLDIMQMPDHLCEIKATDTEGQVHFGLMPLAKLYDDVKYTLPQGTEAPQNCFDTNMTEVLASNPSSQSINLDIFAPEGNFDAIYWKAEAVSESGRYLNSFNNVDPSHPYSNERAVLGTWVDRTLAAKQLARRESTRPTTDESTSALLDLTPLKARFESIVRNMTLGEAVTPPKFTNAEGDEVTLTADFSYGYADAKIEEALDFFPSWLNAFSGRNDFGKTPLIRGMFRQVGYGARTTGAVTADWLVKAAELHDLVSVRNFEDGNAPLGAITANYKGLAMQATPSNKIAYEIISQENQLKWFEELEAGGVVNLNQVLTSQPFQYINEGQHTAMAAAIKTLSDNAGEAAVKDAALLLSLATEYFVETIQNNTDLLMDNADIFYPGQSFTTSIADWFKSPEEEAAFWEAATFLDDHIFENGVVLRIIVLEQLFTGAVNDQGWIDYQQVVANAPADIRSAFDADPLTLALYINGDLKTEVEQKIKVLDLLPRWNARN